MEARDISQALSDLFPLWTDRIGSIELRDSPSARPAGNDGRAIYINSRLMAGMTDADCVFFAARELIHIQLNHFARGSGKDPAIWRSACNAVANSLLRKEGLQLPSGMVPHTEADGKSAEDMYGVFLAAGNGGDEEAGLPFAGAESSKENSSLSSSGSGKTRSIDDPGLASAIAGLAELLEPSFQTDFDWFPGSTVRDGVISYDFRAYPVARAELLIDTSASVDAALLRMFIRGVKGLMQQDALIRVGCFDTQFYGFEEIHTEQDIEALELHGSGGTDFTVAVSAFTGDAENQIILTDGYAEMPETFCDAIWVVYGNSIIHPKGGRVLYVRPADEREKHEIDFLIT